MRSLLLVFLFFAIPLSSIADQGPLVSVGGVWCGAIPNPYLDSGNKVVPTGTRTYLYDVNSAEVVSEAVELNLSLQFLLCSKLNNEFTWLRLQKPYGLYASTQRVHLVNEKWKAKGYWDTATIELTEKSGIYNVQFSKMNLKKLLTTTEYANWKSGKATDVFIKLEVASEKIAYYIGGYMVLKLSLAGNAVEAQSILK